MKDRFLKGLWNYLNPFSAKQAVSHFVNGWTPQDQPTASEPLARYIYSKSDFGAGRVKHRAFMPQKNKKTGRYETSVFRVCGLSSDGIFELSNSARNDRQPKATALHLVSDVHGAKLELEPNNIPERHADIVSWPEEKFERQERAMELASKASLNRYDD